jgi:hypothetical protein
MVVSRPISMLKTMGVLSVFAASLASAQTYNVWTNVTPAGPGANLTINGAYGTETVGADPNKPSDLYANFNEYGIYKSTDYGLTWNGPVNTGTNGGDITGDGNFSIASGGPGKPPILYGGFIHNSAGFWRSTDGGVDWTNFQIPVAGSQDVYQPDVDPNDPMHIILGYHERDGIAQSSDGGQTWTSVSIDAGMHESGGTGYPFFVNTGNPATTRTTFLWISQNTVGTWRTTNSGTTWTRVDLNCHPHGACQIFQPGNGVIFIAGGQSTLGNGVLRSTDYGQTWTHVGENSGQSQSGVFGTPSHVYSMFGWACVPCSIYPAFQVAALPGISGWTSPATPAGMTGGGFSDVAVTYDGSHYILVASMWDKGLWRYIEDSPTGVASPASSRESAPSAAARKSGFVLSGQHGAQGSTAYDIRGRAVDKKYIARRMAVVRISD